MAFSTVHGSIDMSSASAAASCFADPLGGLPATEWDQLAGSRFYSSALWLRLCAMSPGSVSGAVHTPLSGGGRAAIPVAAVDSEPNPFCRWHDVLTSRGLPAPPPQGILVGQRRGYLAHLLSTPGAGQAEVAAELLAAIRALKAPEDRPQAVQVGMYLTTPDVVALRTAGVETMPVALSADAWIEIPPGGWDAWLESLGSSHRQRQVRNEVKKFGRAGYRVRSMTLGEAYGDVARLMAATGRRYGQSPDVAALTDSLRRQGELAGQRARVLLCAKEAAPAVGFCLYYRLGDTVYGRAVGFDYEQLNSAAEYFNLAYYIPARLPGVRWLHAGIETPLAKALRGARLRPLWLLDLSPGSELAGRDDEVLAHNRAFLNELAGSSPVVADALESDLWATFC
jgi:uncharacterized protein